MAAGATTMRGCIRGEYPGGPLELRAPQIFCPVCSQWPTIRDRNETGAELFPVWAGKNVLADLCAVAQQRGWDRTEKSGAHSFRRGAARAILSAGGSSAEPLKAGHSHSSAYQLYLDMGQEEYQGVAAILITASDVEV